MPFHYSQAEIHFLETASTIFRYRQSFSLHAQQSFMTCETLLGRMSEELLPGLDEKTAFVYAALRAIGALYENDGFNLASNWNDFNTLIQLEAFPLEAFIDHINIQQIYWVPKLKDFGFSGGGICAALSSIRKKCDEPGPFYQFPRKLYIFKSRLALCPEQKLMEYMGGEIDQFRKLSDFLQRPFNYVSNIHVASLTQLEISLTSSKLRHELGLRSNNDLFAYEDTDLLADECSSFFTKTVLIEEVIKKLEVGDRVSVGTFSHRMYISVKQDENNHTFFVFYDPNEMHCEKICRTPEELANALEYVCQRMEKNNLQLLPLRFRVYENGFNFITPKRFNKEAIVSQAKNVINILINGFSQLYFAIRNNDIETVNLLIKYGADINQPYYRTEKDVNTGMLVTGLFSLLEAAVEHGQIKMVELLLKEYQADFEVGELSPFYLAVSQNRLDFVKLFCENRREDLTNNIPGSIYYAHQNGYHEIKQYLLEHSNKAGLTPLMEMILLDEIGAIKMLLGCGANVNAVSLDGMTVLAWAEKMGNPEVIALLTHCGAVNHQHLQTKMSLFAQPKSHPVTRPTSIQSLSTQPSINSNLSSQSTPIFQQMPTVQNPSVPVQLLVNTPSQFSSIFQNVMRMQNQSTPTQPIINSNPSSQSTPMFQQMPTVQNPSAPVQLGQFSSNAPSCWTNRTRKPSH